MSYTGAYIEGIRLIEYNGKRIICKDLPFQDLSRGAGPYYKMMPHRNAVRKQFNVFYGTGTNATLWPWRMKIALRGFFLRIQCLTPSDHNG